MNNRIAITIGDINGIGIKILINLWLKKNKKNFVLFTNKEIILKYLKKNKLKIKINVVNKNKNLFDFKNHHLNIFNFNAKSFEENTIKSIQNAYNECKKNNLIGMITLPLRKDLIIRKINSKFIGHTEYLQKLDKKEFSNMILYHKKILITPLTTHLSLRALLNKIKDKNYIYNQIYNLNKILQKDFNIVKPKIIISGINPHAGENGYIGLEEEKIFKPIINKIKKNGIIIEGPVSGDSMLNEINLKKYDCFIFIFHDQALIPFKFISKFTGVNYTGNLSIIRTSPDHGTAYNLLRSKKISDKSLINCFKLIKIIKNNRINSEKGKKIIKSKFYT